MNWESIIEGTAAGIAASVVLGLSAYCYTSVRDNRRREEIRKTLTRFSNGQSLHGAYIGISNHTKTRITVRSVSLSGAKSRYRLNPSGRTSTLSIDRDRKLTKEEEAEVKSGKMVQISQEIGFTHSWDESPAESGFIDIVPFTSHDFFLPAQLLADFDDQIDGVLIIAEYLTSSGSIELIEGKIIDDMHGLNQSIAHYIGQIKSGSLNTGRARFGLPQIKIPKK